MDSKGRGKQKIYDHIVWEGNSRDEGMKKVAEGNWTLQNATKSKGGDRVQTLLCRHKRTCELKGRLRENVNSNEITLETCGVCSCVVDGGITFQQHGLPDGTKDFLNELFHANFTTVGKVMDRMRQLQKKGELPIDMPLEPKVVSYWKTIRTKSLTKALLELKPTPTDMQNFADSNRETADMDLDKPFVAGFQMQLDGGLLAGAKPTFQMVIATLRLLSFSPDYVNFAHADDTHNTVWFDCPLILLGGTDKARTFHP
jgi:hypothetical protein